MKRTVSVFMLLIMLFSLAVPAMAEGEDYVFTILADGSANKQVALDTEFTVTLKLSRADGEKFDMYSMQDYICFDPDYVRLVEDSIITYSDAENSSVFNASPLRFGTFTPENYTRVFVNRPSDSAVSMDSGSVIVSFKLKAIQVGTTEITHRTTELFKEVGEMYTFTRETATVEIVEQLRTLPFTDVSENDWFYDQVAEAYFTGVFSGQTDTLFMPYDNITRGQFAAVIHRMAGSPENTYEGELFYDVPADYWCAKSVYWAYDNEVVAGYSDGYYRPLQTITRQQMVAMLWRYAGFPESGVDISTFDDADTVAEYARPALAWAIETGIIVGTNDNTLNPEVNTYRAQAAVILMRFKNVMSELYGWYDGGAA